jgi:hypothetical protein
MMFRVGMLHAVSEKNLDHWPQRRWEKVRIHAVVYAVGNRNSEDTVASVYT